VAHGAKADAAFEKAKDPSRPITERVMEGASAVKEKINEKWSNGKAAMNEEKMKN